jgi:hypothetical protein
MNMGESFKLTYKYLATMKGIPTSYARVGANGRSPLPQVDSSRHLWSFWNALSKKLKGVKGEATAICSIHHEKFIVV